jgi:small nuclear ribonucleoprotein (snRNP)-like protein
MRRAYRDLVASNVIVSMKTDKAFRGVLWSEHRELLVLRNAVLLEHDQEVDVDGEVVIERANIDFIQVTS